MTLVGQECPLPSCGWVGWWLKDDDGTGRLYSPEGDLKLLVQPGQPVPFFCPGHMG